MCGICGIALQNEQIESSLLQAMADALTHRGPDGHGTFLDGTVALGHRRLSIIDLQGGAQPMYNEDGSLAIVFNGEIYNYLELRPELVSAGHVFQTQSDTEVILHLYEDHGTRCVEKLNGMFALAIWDARNRLLFVARDRLGEKPLFYYSRDGRFAFASEVKSLLRAPFIRPQVSATSLDDYLAYGYVPGDECILKDVAKLPPGCFLTHSEGRTRVERYWDVDFHGSNGQDDCDWMAELEDRLRESVRIRLRSDVPLGVFLSGGIDSSAITAIASQVSSTPIKTFSIGFSEAGFSEGPFARRVGEQLRAEHQELVVRDQDISILPELAYFLDEPFADPSALPTYFVCREARKHVTVCLSGDGGDEVFAGYPRYREAMRFERLDRLGGAGLRQLCGAIARAAPRRLPGVGLAQRLGTTGAGRYFAQCCKFLRWEREALLSPDATHEMREDPWLFSSLWGGGRTHDVVTRLQYVDQKTYLPDDILVKVDRMSMMNSLEVRPPFLDHTLVEFVNRAPLRHKIRDGIAKYALRRLLERHFPGDLFQRPKRGFGIPLRTWFRGGLREYAQVHLLGADARSPQWFRREAVTELLADHDRGGRDLTEKIWTLLMFELWCRQYRI